MTELLKNSYYNYDSLQKLALWIKYVYPLLCVEDFIEDIMDETWDSLKLKERMRKVTINLRKHLPDDYEQSLSIIDKVILNLPKGFNDNALIYFPDFVELYGQDDCNWDLSIAALERYTQSSTAEFAVRPFIIKNERRMMTQMAVWAKHDNDHVRRLASEGCRPALPWGQALVSFKKNPLPVINILKHLKNDSSLYVRKSVANNLNDISKTHPDLVIKIVRDWYGKNSYTDWIVKHGCRTLLKKGNQNVLALFGFVDVDCINIKDFMVDTPVISIGNDLIFSFLISVKTGTKIRMEYIIDYVKANGRHSQKTFQISEICLKANQERFYKKTHSFANLSTRKHYPGVHSVTLVVNGLKCGTLDFVLDNAN